MAITKESMAKAGTYIGYVVYVVTIIYGGYMVFADPTTLYKTSPSQIQIGGMLLVAYGLIECAVTIYNRLPPVRRKTAEQIAIDKSKLRERNDKKSKERKLQQ